MGLTKKAIALSLTFLLGFTIFGTIGTYITVQATANGIYTVTNNIFFNATSMGRGEATFKLSISQSTDLQPSNLPIKAMETVTGGFEPNITIDLGTQIGVVLQPETPEYFGWGTNENTTVLMAARYVDRLEMMNTSMYYSNFQHTLAAYPVTEKQLIFDSPLNYVQAYCDANGYSLDAIINSTYDESTNYDNLNGLHSELVRTTYAVSEPTPSLHMLKEQQAELLKYGGSLNPNPKFIQLGLLVLYAIIVLAAAATIVGVTMVISGAQTAQYFAGCNLAAVKYGIDKTYNWSTALLGTWTEEQTVAWAAFQAGNLSLQQYQDLCKMYTGQYDPLLSNTTTDFKTLLTDYYGAQNDLFSEYANAFGFGTSWSNIFQYLLIFIIVILAAYMVYALFLRKKNTPVGAGGIVNVFPK